MTVIYLSDLPGISG